HRNTGVESAPSTLPGAYTRTGKRSFPRTARAPKPGLREMNRGARRSASQTILGTLPLFARASTGPVLRRVVFLIPGDAVVVEPYQPCIPLVVRAKILQARVEALTCTARLLAQVFIGRLENVLLAGVERFRALCIVAHLDALPVGNRREVRGR